MIYVEKVPTSQRVRPQYVGIQLGCRYQFDIIFFCRILNSHGVSTALGKWGNFPTRILTLEIYWGISPVKIRFRLEIDPLTFNVLFFCTQNLATPEK